MRTNRRTTVRREIYALQHIETGDFICFIKDGLDYLACFSDAHTAREARTVLGLDEHVDVFPVSSEAAARTRLWLDFECVEAGKRAVHS
jgi:hypothetical protein